MSSRSLYLFFFLLVGLCILWLLNRQHNRHTEYFYGFAENQETEMNLEEDVQIVNILVDEGQAVSKGDTLLEVRMADLDYRLEKVAHETLDLQARERIWESDMRSRIQQQTESLAQKRQERKLKIAQWEANLAFQKEILASVGKQTSSEMATPVALERERMLAGLQAGITADSLQLIELKEELRIGMTPFRIQREKQVSERDWLLVRKDNMIITAPYDGLVGNIHGRVGEHQSSFSTLVTFYEQHPTLVKGYVHESLLVQVRLHDSLDVVSLVRPELSCRGQVVALGTRVVEIPERLRKMPEIKTYGREILVAIPPANEFLQKEKVQLFLESRD
ncbi:MAG: hypothetical protein H6568_08925 [Lewinellaceae bacterium]|nr:hypothetical protein [Saprospiraceae bacterium]MCB9312877.1 hypothetical protein [Lewinellaceae bacterium]